MPKGYKARPAVLGVAAPGTMPASLQREEFARRLAATIRERGWTQSELSRRATDLMPNGQKMGRYSINNYIKGDAFPEPHRLDAICAALGVQPADLVPGYESLGSASSAQHPTMEAIDAGDGMMWLIVRKRLHASIVFKVMQLIAESEHPTQKSDKGVIS